MLLVMCIYSIVAVEIWRDYGKSGWYNNTEGEEVTAITPRLIP